MGVGVWTRRGTRVLERDRERVETRERRRGEKREEAILPPFVVVMSL